MCYLCEERYGFQCIGYDHPAYLKYMYLVRCPRKVANLYHSLTHLNGLHGPHCPRKAVYSLWPSEAIWRQGSWPTLAQVMACCLMAPSHYLTNVDWSSIRSSDIHMRAILQKKLQPPIIKFSLKITYLKFHSNLLGVNELNLITHSLLQQPC